MVVVVDELVKELLPVVVVVVERVVEVVDEDSVDTVEVVLPEEENEVAVVVVEGMVAVAPLLGSTEVEDVVEWLSVVSFVSEVVVVPPDVLVWRKDVEEELVVAGVAEVCGLPVKTSVSARVKREMKQVIKNSTVNSSPAIFRKRRLRCCMATW